MISGCGISSWLSSSASLYRRTEPPKRDISCKHDFYFVKDPPEDILIECPVCFHLMLDGPHLTSCGHHFCYSCIKKIQSKKEPCPQCRTKPFTTFLDKDRLRYIRCLKVMCTNKHSGCTWTGELMNFSDHLAKGKRDGDCKFEEVACPFGCGTRKKRFEMGRHEEECPKKPHKCKYCSQEGPHDFMTNDHYGVCLKYPIPCPKGCSPEAKYPRDCIQTHLDTDCLLKEVECDYAWAGCNVKLLRRDLKKHITMYGAEHGLLLAHVCKYLRKENKVLKRKCETLEKRMESLDDDYDELDRKFSEKYDSMSDDVDDLDEKCQNLETKCGDLNDAVCRLKRPKNK